VAVRRRNPSRLESDPEAKARFIVRAFSASRLASATRLTSMAQVRAKTIARMMRVRVPGRSVKSMRLSVVRGATRKVARMAKGRAKTEWASLMSASARLMRRVHGRGVVGVVGAWMGLVVVTCCWLLVVELDCELLEGA